MKFVCVLFIVMIICCCGSVISQSVFPKTAKQYWERMPDASAYYYENEQFVGILLDGSKLSYSSKYFLTRIIQNKTNLSVDTNSFVVDIDSSIVWKFEKLLKDTLAKNDTLITFQPQDSINSYYRQYVKFHANNSDYLFVGFHIADSLVREPQKDGSKVFLNELDKLICSRFFLSQSYNWVTYDTQFFVLYEIAKEKMNFVYFESKRKEKENK